MLAAACQDAVFLFVCALNSWGSPGEGLRSSFRDFFHTLDAKADQAAGGAGVPLPKGLVSRIISVLSLMRLVLTSLRFLPMSGVHDLIPLAFAPPGQTARVAQVVGACEEVHRLKELGLSEGVMVEIVQPGTPCIVRIAGHKLCFRDCDSFRVLVSVGAAG
jgi:Fe2+ transport system protein FeoA